MSLKYIDIRYFIVSFALGVCAVYLFEPDKKNIMVYPSPDNYEHTQYKDKAGNYFVFRQTKTKCTNNDNILKVPIQSS